MNVISIILPIFAVIGIGYLARHLNVVKSRASHTFNNFVYYIALPFLVLQGILKLDVEQLLNWKLLTLNILSMAVLSLIVAFITLKILKTSKKTAAMFILASYFGNVAYVGIPFNELAFGPSGSAIATIIAILVVIFSVVVGLGTLKVVANDKKAKIIDIILQVFKIPLIWAALIGFFMVVFKIPVHSTINEFIGLFARLAGPLALFSLGMFAYESKFGHDLKHSSMLALFNLVALPIVVYLLAIYLGVTGLELKVSIMQAGMPIAVSTFVFSQKFKIEEKLISDSVVFSVILAPLTLALLLFFVERL